MSNNDAQGEGAERFVLRFGTPRHGWLDVELVGPEGASRFSASDVPGDSLSTLVEATRDLAEGREPRAVTWFLEPVEVTWWLHNEGERVWLVTRSGVEGPVRVGAGTVVGVSLLVWRAMRRLGSAAAWRERESSRCWSHPFPSAAVEALGRKLNRGVTHRERRGT